MRNLLVIGMLSLSVLCSAQTKKKVKPDYVYCYKETSLETDDYKIYVVDGRAEAEYSKCKVRIFNKTNDYLVFKPTEFSFKIGDQELTPKDKQIVVPPNDEESKVIDVKGPACQVDKYTLEIRAYYKVANNGPAIQVEDFNLPPTKNEFKAGPFDCKHMDNKLKTEKSIIKFGCTYTGDGIGVMDTYRCSAVMPGGKDNANSKRYKPSLLEKGKFEDFFVEIKTIPNTGDMANQPFKIKWNDTFKESKASPLKGSKIDIEIDNKLTEEKNN